MAKKASTRISQSVDEMHDEHDEKMKNRMPVLRPGSQLLGKQKKGTARNLITDVVDSDRPVNVYIERVVDAESGKMGLWLWHTTEQSNIIGKVKLVEINPQTLMEIHQGDEWDTPYTKENAESIAAECYGKSQFMFKDGDSKTTITRDQFLDFDEKIFNK